MLTIIEILFFIIGLWGLIKGKFPQGLFKTVFGKGEYNLTPKKARLFGFLLITPLPIALLVGFILGLFFGKEAIGAGLIFEIVFDLAVIIAAVIIARRVRTPEIAVLPEVPPTLIGLPAKNRLTPVKKALLTFLLILLVLVVATSFGALVITVLSIILYGGRTTGNFWDDTFPFILSFVIIAGGVVGIIQIVKRLRRG